MYRGFSNKPKILRGAFVEFGVSFPPLIVVFQFNPEQLLRKRNLQFKVPNNVGVETHAGKTGNVGDEGETPRFSSLREWHREHNLLEIQKQQKVTYGQESISFELKLDATDKLEEEDPIARQFGIAPQLSALELMTHPKGVLGLDLAFMLGKKMGLNYTGIEANPPMVLFIWGIKRVLPVNIGHFSIKETEFNTMLDPVRAIVSVDLTVIEGQNAPYTYSKTMKQVMGVVNMANLGDIANVVIPG